MNSNNGLPVRKTHFSQYRINGQSLRLSCVMIFLLSLFSVPAKSQVLIALLFGDKLNTDKLEFGLMVGPNFSYISNSNANGKAGLGLGLYFNLKCVTHKPPISALRHQKRKADDRSRPKHR
jgi:hypothetical protein